MHMVMSFVLFILHVLFHIQNNSVHSIFHKKYLQPSEEIDEKAEIKTSDMCPEMQEDAITFAIQVSSIVPTLVFL